MQHTTFVFARLLAMLIWGLGFTLTTQAQSTSPMSITNTFIPSGYMDDAGTMLTNFRDETRPDKLCIKIIYTPKSSGWGGIYWQYPANNWCKVPGLNLSNYKKLSFYVRGETGGEIVKFKFGHDCGDSYALNPPLIKQLTVSWEKVTINLAGMDLSNITGAFAWIVDAQANQGKPITFYLDDIQCE